MRNFLTRNLRRFKTYKNNSFSYSFSHMYDYLNDLIFTDPNFY